MQENFDREKTQMELTHEQARKEMMNLHENQMKVTKEEFYTKLTELEATKNDEIEKLRKQMQSQIDDLME
jgi:hypothetical protein